MTALIYASAAEAVAEVTENLCKTCLRYQATDEDWVNIPEGEGAELCWEEGSCSWSPFNDKTYEGIIIEAVLKSLTDKGLLVQE